MRKDDLEVLHIVEQHLGRIVGHYIKNKPEGRTHHIRIHYSDIYDRCQSPHYDETIDWLDCLRENIPNVKSVRWASLRSGFNGIVIVI